MIKHISFKHGWWYFYRIHEPKTAELTTNYPSLKKYLYDMFTDCPHDYFHVEPRSSKLRFNLNDLKLKHIAKHEVTELTKQGHIQNATRYQSAHSRVQLFMLENDKNTLAIEVPLWLQAEELGGYEQLFGTTNPLTGHIDALRIEDEKIWIWDYKPHANKEKFASTQLYFYAYMLSKRTNIPLQRFRCGYFDDQNTYIFNPNFCSLTPTQQKKLQ